MARSLLVLFSITLSAFAEPRRDRHGDPLPDGAIARFGTVRYRVGESTLLREKSWDLSADGKTLAIETTAGINLWDVDSGLCRAQFRVPGFVEPEGLGCSILRFSPDGKLIVRASFADLRVLDAKTGNTCAKFDGPGPVSSISFSDNSRFVVLHQVGEALSEYDTIEGRVKTVTLKQRLRSHFGYGSIRRFGSGADRRKRAARFTDGLGARKRHTSPRTRSRRTTASSVNCAGTAI